MNPTVLTAQLAWRNRRAIGVGLVAMGAAAWLGMLLVVAGLAGGSPAPPALQAVSYSCTDGQAAAGLSPEQTANAAIIIQVGQRLAVPPKGLLIAIATALQESSLRNLDHGDRDSLGLFQQRPSTGWGTPAQIMDPHLSAEAFYGRAAHTKNRGLLAVPGWQDLPVTVAAQAVQASAFPGAYAQHEARAVAIVEQVTGTSGLCRVVSGAGLGTGPWRLPVAGEAYTLTSQFGMRNHPILGRLVLHAGTDLAAPTGTPVSAVHEGTVTFAGVMEGYGNLVIIDHGGSVSTRYGHLSVIGTTAGAKVPVGAIIGAVGSTGQSTGPHLHLEVRINEQPIDPLPFLRARGVELQPRAAQAN